jgi:hypothetical protein
MSESGGEGEGEGEREREGGERRKISKHIKSKVYLL